MGKYIVKITEKRTREVVVDAGNQEEAELRGVAAVLGRSSKMPYQDE